MAQQSRLGWPILVAAIALTALGAPGVARAVGEADDEIGVELGIGAADEDLAIDGADSPYGPVLGVRYGHVFTDAFGVSAGAWYVPTYSGTVGSGDWKETSVAGYLDWFFATTKRTQWFLSPGVGWAKFEPDQGSSESRGFASLAFGQKIWPGNPDANLRWLIRADQTVTGGGSDGTDLLNYKLLFGAAWGFGGPPPDDDGDRVPNRKDECPGTPAGATVDEKGCPKDSDGDGVFDGIDRCPDTPKGWPVDATGCPTDSDGDGVPDGKDACPETPKGATVDDKGCPKDSDGDGVFDGIDRCPETPKGATVDDKGCPTDSDGDGVFDGIDRCPDSPKGVKVDDRGCPLVEKAPPLFTAEKKTLVLDGVSFEFNSEALTEASHAVLDRVAVSLNDWPDVRVEVGGHTDSRGADAYNEKLSERRAAAVQQYLASKGIAASRMTVKGYGESKPVADNAMEEDRARNRRVELTRTD